MVEGVESVQGCLKASVLTITCRRSFRALSGEGHDVPSYGMTPPWVRQQEFKGLAAEASSRPFWNTQEV